jgi:uncharacterized protein YndB with AHSA1/START domain
MTVTNPETTIATEITIDAPPAKIFAALTEPDQLPQWWGEEGSYHVESMERDLRVGGRWRSSGKGPDGQSFSVEGVYRTIDPPHVLEYTWNYDWDPNAAETLVRFDLLDRAGGTLVRVTHSGFVDPKARDNHREGWPRVLGWLASYVAPGK